MQSLEKKILELDFLDENYKITLALVACRRKNSGETYYLKNQPENAQRLEKFFKETSLNTYSFTIPVYDKTAAHYQYVFMWHETSRLPEDFKSLVQTKVPGRGSKPSSTYRKELEEYYYNLGMMFGYPECCVEKFSETGHFTKVAVAYHLDVLNLYEKRKPIDELVATLYVPCSVKCEATLNSGNGAFLKENLPTPFNEYKKELLKSTREYRKGLLRRKA